MRNDLGHYGSMAEVWKHFPSGGRPGDCLWIGSVLHVWDSAQGNWRNDVYPNMDTYKAVRLHGDLGVGNDLFVGGDVNVMQDIKTKRNLKVEGVLEYNKLKGYDCGLYGNIHDLRSAIPAPVLGQWALVGTSAQSMTLYGCRVTGTWDQIGSAQSLYGAFDLAGYDAAKAIVEDLATRGFVFMGVATPDTVPVKPSDHNVFYLTSTPGRYTYFGGVNVKTLSVLEWHHAANPNSDALAAGMWTCTNLLTGVFVYEENIAVGAVTLRVAPEIAERITQVEDDAVHSRAAGAVYVDTGSTQPSSNIITNSSEIL